MKLTVTGCLFADNCFKKAAYDACFERVRKALANPGILALEIQGGTEKLRQELLASVSSDPFQGF